MSELSLEDFTRHVSGGGGGGRFLSKWRDDKRDTSVDVLLHRKAPVVGVWRHPIPRVDIVEDEKTRQPVKRLRGAQWVCRDPEEVVKNQNRRSRENGARLVQPVSCGVCKLVEHVHSRVLAGDVPWTKEVFVFDADDGRPVTLRAAGLYNGFSRDDLTKSEKAEMNRLGISPYEAWKQNIQAKLSWVFRVLQYDSPASGIQIATESSLLGDRVKALIKAEQARDPDKGNPAKNPYVIRWSHLPSEKEFGKKYDAIRVEQEITEEMLRLISGEAPGLEQMTSPYDPQTLRAALQRACVLDGIPWDEYFGPLRAGAETPKPGTPQAVPEDTYGCDKCGLAVKGSDKQCPHCGFVFPAEPPPPPAPLPKRSSAKVVPLPVTPVEPEPDPDQEITDSIPF